MTRRRRSVGLKGQGGPGVSETRGGARGVIDRRHEAPPRVTGKLTETLTKVASSRSRSPCLLWREEANTKLPYGGVERISVELTDRALSWPPERGVARQSVELDRNAWSWTEARGVGPKQRVGRGVG